MRSVEPPTPESDAPFGVEPRRSSGLLWFWGALYVAWLAALIWMAARQSQL
jgi:hypothetical protein